MNGEVLKRNMDSQKKYGYLKEIWIFKRKYAL